MMNSNEAHTALKTMPAVPLPRGIAPKPAQSSNSDRFVRFLKERGIHVNHESATTKNDVRWLD